MTVRFLLLALQLSLWAMVVEGGDAALQPMTISLQVSFMSVPYYISVQKGDFEKLGLNVTEIVYPSGTPQVNAAIVNKTWDAGVAGVVPTIGAGDKGILNVAIACDQSAINQLVGLAEIDWPPSSLDNLTIALTPNSTGQYVVQACLATYDTSKVNWIYGQQDLCVGAMLPTNGSAPKAQLGGLWSPNTYRVLDNSKGSKTLCTGESVYKKVTGGIMVRKEFADENPDLVTKLLAGWLRGIAFMKNPSNRDATLDYISEFYIAHGLNLTRDAVEKDLTLFGLFNLDDQLKSMTRSGTPPSSDYDYWTIAVSEFLVANKVLSSYALPTTYITDTYLQNIKKNAILSSFAVGEDVDLSKLSATTASNVAQTYSFTCGWLLLVVTMTAGWLL